MASEKDIYVVGSDFLGNEQVVLHLIETSPCCDSCTKSCMSKKKLMYEVIAVQKSFGKKFALGKKIESCEVYMAEGFGKIERFLPITRNELTTRFLKMDLVLKNKTLR